METKSVRINMDILLQAEIEAKKNNRSLREQIELWVKIGKAVDSKMSIADAYSISQGISKLRIEPKKNIGINSENVFNVLESNRCKGFSDKPITSAPFYFEASIQQPGLLDKVITATGERKTGIFKNGVFEIR